MNETAGKWRDLAEKRHAHLLEMKNSGRWKYYFTETVFLRRLENAGQLVDLGAPILPGEPAETPTPQIINGRGLRRP